MPVEMFTGQLVQGYGLVLYEALQLNMLVFSRLGQEIWTKSN